MSRVYLVTCTSGSASQQWDVMADGRIALVASKPQECLDLQYSEHHSFPVAVTVFTFWNGLGCHTLGYVAGLMSYSVRAVPNNPVGLYSCAGLGGIGAADNGLNWPLVNATS